ncbi:MAG TPA: DUF2617 family protein [Micromonosporaceae bacterium]|nr:DUF2617 family protein [Micromonosporaceae bacterium]
MLVSIDTPYADTTAGDLSFALGLPEQPALHVLEIPAAGLRLRLLGASHQVVLADRCVETVACLPGRPPSLPAAVEDGAYRFAAAVHRLDPASMSQLVARLRERLADDPHALVGMFPGDRDAVTALRARAVPGTTRWRTWHAYPQTGELVVTRTEVIG